MEAESATTVNQTSPRRSGQCGSFRTFQAQLQVSMEAESATGVNQTSPWRPGPWGSFRTFQA
eukprot:12314621-Karenia_brevis.AAC.1